MYFAILEWRATTFVTFLLLLLGKICFGLYLGSKETIFYDCSVVCV